MRSRTTEDPIDRLTNAITTLVETNAQRVGSSVPTARGDVIPTFNPGIQSSFSILEWCKKVDEIRHIFRWSEEATIYFATSKLQGMADIWYNSLPSVRFSWAEWKIKLQQSFPAKRDFHTNLQDMIKRTKRSDETYCKYYFEKSALLNTCNITGIHAVSCIIGGMFDNVVKTGAKAGNHQTPESLYNYLSSLGNTAAPHSGTNHSHLRKSIRPQNASNHKSGSKTRAPLVCFKCQKPGHVAIHCPSNNRSQGKDSDKRCDYCRFRGHWESECPKKKHGEKQTI
ncbi:hypothetical protein HUJ04_009227 [Dendroctonus ponderosae]|nr:hypothetical protein HUJ04_009227 [Dendroctonus ponderosae]